MTEYVPPKVWKWEQPSGGQFASINRPIAGATHDKVLPVGKHPFQLYQYLKIIYLLLLRKSGAYVTHFLVINVLIPYLNEYQTPNSTSIEGKQDYEVFSHFFPFFFASANQILDAFQAE